MIHETGFHERLDRGTSPPPEDARAEMLAVLRGVASARDTIFYGDLARRITTTRLRANDPRLYALLNEISEAEYQQGRGMLSVVVISRERQEPGYGFFRLGRKLGRALDRTRDWWKEELGFVHDHWSGLAARQATSQGKMPVARTEDRASRLMGFREVRRIFFRDRAARHPRSRRPSG